MAKITIKPLGKNDQILLKASWLSLNLQTKGENMKIIIQNIRDFLLRKKRKGKKLLFLEKIGDRNSTRDEIKQNLIKILKKNGWKIKGGPDGNN